MIVKMSIFLMKQQSTSYHYVLPFLQAKPLQLITTTIMKDSIFFEPNINFQLLFIYFIVSQIYQKNLYVEIYILLPCYIFDFIFCQIYILVISSIVTLPLISVKTYLKQEIEKDTVLNSLMASKQFEPRTKVKMLTFQSEEIIS